MDKRLQEIFNDVKTKKITTISERLFEFEILFTKDESGKSLLEYALEQNTYISSEFESRFAEYPEVICMYLDKDKYLGNIPITEETLFTSYNGKYIIEYFAEKNKIYSAKVGSVQNHLEIFDIFEKYERYYDFNYLNEKIIEDLFTLQPDGTFYIEKFVSNDKFFIQLISVVKNPCIIGVCRKHGKKDLIKYVNEDLLLKDSGNGKTYLEELLNEGIELNKVNNLPSNEAFIRELIKLGKFDVLSNAEEPHMFVDANKEFNLLEYLIENNLIDELHFSVSSVDTFEILERYNRFDLIKRIDDKFILMSTNEILNNGVEIPMYQYLLENGAKNVFTSFYDKPVEVIQYLVNTGRTDLLENGCKNNLNEEVKPGVTVLDVLMDNKVDVSLKYGKVDDSILERVLNKRKFEFFHNFSSEQLLRTSSDGKTYFEHILLATRNKEYVSKIHQFVNEEYDFKFKAQLICYVAKYKLMNYIDKLGEKKLLRKSKDVTLLEYLLDVDPDLTVNSIIKKSDLTNMKIVFILKERGIDTPGYDTPLINEKGYDNEYLDKGLSTMGIGPMLSDAQMYLTRIEELFLNDGKSDKDLINALISSYREALICNYEVTINELASLVKIKEENPDKFFYLSSKDGSYFRPMTGSVYCDSRVTTTLIHETGHALHHYLTEEKIPEGYAEILQTARDNSVNIEAVEEFAEEYHKIIEEVRNDVLERYQSYFESYYNGDRRQEIEEFLNKSKEAKKAEYLKLGVSESVVDVIIEKAFTVDEYIEHEKRVFIEEYINAKLRSEHNIMMVTGDILDAIYGGQLHSRELRNAEGKRIKGTCGHGIAYYGSYDHGFDEMVANFATILKTRTAEDDLRRLRDLIGQEVFDMISDFYYTNISKSEPLSLDEGPKL